MPYIQKTLSENKDIDIRRKHRLQSPKQYGSSDIDALPFLKELGAKIVEKKQPIQFNLNMGEHIHRWAPYVQGFSSYFVQSVLDKYKNEFSDPSILDPFAGCGTVLVQAKLNGHKSFGIELNPLLQFIAQTKLNSWDVPPALLLRLYNSMPKDRRSSAPKFLKSKSHFKVKVLENLEIIKGGIEAIEPTNVKEKKAKDLIRLAFASILIDCSNLKRSPCLGYSKNKHVADSAPFILLENKIQTIANDLKFIQSEYKDYISVKSDVVCANSIEYTPPEQFDLIITSPPYMSGMDYVINYKIEMGWLGYINSHKKAKEIKDSMVVCDNVSKGIIKEFSKYKEKYTNSWIEKIKTDIQKNIEKRGSYRRPDMPEIVHKYFDDMYKIMKNVVGVLKDNGRFILVVGDSLIADVYVPSDLLIAKIGMDLGLRIEKLEKARTRRSGQIRSYRLRETIITLKK